MDAVKGWKEQNDKVCAAVTAYLYPLPRVREREREEKELVRNRHPDDEDVKTLNTLLLPSSSSSDVMDLERMDKAVVGARFGGGGAEEHIETEWCKKQTNIET